MALFKKRRSSSVGLRSKPNLPQSHHPTPKTKTTFRLKTCEFRGPCKHRDRTLHRKREPPRFARRLKKELNSILSLSAFEFSMVQKAWKRFVPKWSFGFLNLCKGGEGYYIYWRGALNSLLNILKMLPNKCKKEAPKTIKESWRYKTTGHWKHRLLQLGIFFLPLSSELHTASDCSWWAELLK